MERCLFGTEEDERYQTFDDEMEQFGIAMQALGLKEEGEESEGASSSVPVPQGG